MFSSLALHSQNLINNIKRFIGQLKIGRKLLGEYSLPPRKKTSLGEGKQGTVWGVKLVKKNVFSSLRGSGIYEFSMLEIPWTHFQTKQNWCTLYDSEINNIYIVVILQILIHWGSIHRYKQKTILWGKTEARWWEMIMIVGDRIGRRWTTYEMLNTIVFKILD